MQKSSKVNPGDRVFRVVSADKGVVTSVRDPDNCFVVYSANNDWESYQKYTGELTKTSELVLGWPDEDAAPECYGEVCKCGNHASHKISEVTSDVVGHPHTAYICHTCFSNIFLHNKTQNNG